MSSTVEGCSVMYTPDSCTNFNNTTDHKMYDVSGFSEKTDWVRVFRGRPEAQCVQRSIRYQERETALLARPSLGRVAAG